MRHPVPVCGRDQFPGDMTQQREEVVSVSLSFAHCLPQVSVMSSSPYASLSLS